MPIKVVEERVHDNDLVVQESRTWNGKDYDYDADYNDHFETPRQAYMDVLPLLDAVTTRPRHQHILYDPYYCDGQSQRILQSLGFTNVHHAKRDFYQDIQNGTVPYHDTVITNPPYSDDHKERCLQFCIEQLMEKEIPFFVLLPTYVAAKHYYRRLPHIHNVMMYLVPSNKNAYQYTHPQGTGHAISPFDSMWFCGMKKQRQNHMIKKLQQHVHAQQDNVTNTVLYTSLAELASANVITLENRPNPHQRKKKRNAKRMYDQLLSRPKNEISSVTLSKIQFSTITSNPAKKKTRNKKYNLSPPQNNAEHFISTTFDDGDVATRGESSNRVDNVHQSKLPNSTHVHSQQHNKNNNNISSSSGSSKYRDTSGKRTKKRF